MTPLNQVWTLGSAGPLFCWPLHLEGTHLTKHLIRNAGLAAMTMLSLSAAAATSTFDLDAEGWTAAGDIEGPLTWLDGGGNPGGHVQIDDLTIGGVTFFVAPAKFLGNQSAAAGSLLRFDLKQVYPGGANQFNDEDVILRGSGLTLVYNTASNPTNGAWTSYAVPLSAAGWKLNTLNGAAATEGQFAAVLSNLTGLTIRAEYQTGPDVGHLDNVALVPEPGAWALLLAGLGVVGGLARRTGRPAG